MSLTLLKKCMYFYIYIHTSATFLRFPPRAKCITLRRRQIDQNTVKTQLYVDDALLYLKKKKVQAFQAATEHVSGCLMLPT